MRISSSFEKLSSTDESHHHKHNVHPNIQHQIPNYPPHPQRSHRAIHQPRPLPPRRPPRKRPIRMALYPLRPPLYSLLFRNLPRPHNPSPQLPFTPPVLPLPHPVRPLRSQPRDLPQHLRPPRRNVAASMGDSHSARGATGIHGRRSKRPSRRDGNGGGRKAKVGRREQAVEM